VEKLTGVMAMTRPISPIQIDDATCRIVSRKQGREASQEVISLIRSCIADIHDQCWLESYFRTLLKFAAYEYYKFAESESADSARPSRNELLAFEKSFWPFGKYSGQPVHSIPLDYLDWWLGESQLLARKVSAYLDMRRMELIGRLDQQEPREAP
jgi:uncharacterized protein (DUF3820 family)